MPLLDWIKHKKIMVSVLKDVYKNKLLGGTLGFKGGTAAMLFYHLPRKSVDLDFDLLDLTQENEVLNNIMHIAEKYGTIKEKHVKRHTIFFLLSYGDNDANIKIEISRRGPQGKYIIQDYLGISLLVMRKEDMFANKLIALMDRKHTVSRDIYDIWFFMREQWNVNTKIIKKRTGKSFDVYCREAADFVENFSSRKLLAGLGELIDEKQKSWVKEHLLEDTAFELRFLCENEKKL